MNSRANKKAGTCRYVTVVDTLPPGEEAIDTKLEVLANRRVTLSLHLSAFAAKMETLEKTRDLKSLLSPVPFPEDGEFRRMWNGILNKCALDLRQLTIDGLRDTLNGIREETAEVEQIFIAVLPEGRYDYMEAQLDSKFLVFKIGELDRELHKFKREVLDYTLYPWARRSPQGQNLPIAAGTSPAFPLGGKSKGFDYPLYPWRSPQEQSPPLAARTPPAFPLGGNSKVFDNRLYPWAGRSPQEQSPPITAGAYPAFPLGSNSKVLENPQYPRARRSPQRESFPLAAGTSPLFPSGGNSKAEGVEASAKRGKGRKEKPKKLGKIRSHDSEQDTTDV